MIKAFSRKAYQGPAVDLTVLHAKIGELTLENDFLAGQGGFAERKAMIDRSHDLPITRQAKVLNVNRGSVYSAVLNRAVARDCMLFRGQWAEVWRRPALPEGHPKWGN